MIALADRQTLTAAIETLPHHKRAAVEARLRWLKEARPKQIPPRQKSWFAWLCLAGRGFGKTRAVAEDTWWQAAWRDETRWAVVAPTANDLRRTCFEGESGLLDVVPHECLRGGSIDSAYNRSLFELSFANKSIIQGFTSEAYERLRGPQFHGAMVDELAAFQRDRAAWDMLMMTLRLGEDPRVVIATTPKPTKLIRELVSRADTFVERGTTYENRSNLAPPFLAMLQKQYEGTRIGRQELHAEILEDVTGALFTWQMVEAARYFGALPQFRLVTVNIDPSASDGSEDTDECGITATALGEDDLGYVLADRSRRDTPRNWARAAVGLYHEMQANYIVAEANQGGTMVEEVIHGVDPNVPVKLVHASRGKQLRAEPVSSLYEQGRVRHCGIFAELESQMTGWSPSESKYSPDRLDSLVWGLTSLMVQTPAEFFCALG